MNTDNTKAHTSLRFRLAITAEDYLAYYRGRARAVRARSEDGRNVEFPANNLQKFLTHQGIYGLFEIRFDGNHKLIGIDKIGN